MYFKYQNDIGNALSSTSNNRIWIRGQDTDDWVLVTKITEANSDWVLLDDINISQVLSNNNHTPSTSTQIKIEHRDLFDLTIGEISVVEIEALPVSLTSFTATKVGASEVHLEWTTAEEANNKHFEIQVARSEEAVLKGEFDVIGQIPGQGTTTLTTDYNFWDRSANKTGNYYYRLRQVDFDGAQEYSQIELVSFRTVIEQIQVYPNPFVNQLKIDYQSEVPQSLDIQVVDGQGKIVDTFVKTIEVGSNNLALNLSEHLAAGLYMVKIIAEDQQFSVHRLNKIRQ